MSLDLDRRRFLGASSGVLAGLVSSRHSLAGNYWNPTSLIATAVDDVELDASRVVQGKDSRLIVLSKSPTVLETPLELMRTGQVVPAEFLFVRNNQQPAGTENMSVPSPDGWQIEFVGMLNRTAKISLSSILELDMVEHEMVLQCSGNSRTLFSAAAKVSGTAWGRGGFANVRFGGVPLSRVLEENGIEIQPGVKYLAAEGIDAPKDKSDDFEHSLPIDDVLKMTFLATTLNGKPLPAVHGGPVRLMTPGVYGTVHVKWLSRLRFEAEESNNDYQVNNYRVPLSPIKPGTEFRYTKSNSAPNWRMKVKNVILSPTPDAVLKNREVTIEGVAFNDGASPIESVIVSMDHGQSWKPARLESSSSPYAWTRFRFSQQLETGRYEVWTRAIDALGNSQPIDGAINWNPRGYEWNGVEKIKFSVA